MTRAAQEAVGRGSRVVVAAGGDGSVGAVAGAVAGTDASLGVIPLGTLNHFAKDVGIPLDLSKAVQTIVAGKTVPVDVGDLNGHLFVNNASIGMYARLVGERTAIQRLGRRKWVAHGFAAWRVWRRYRRIHAVLHVNGSTRKVRTPFLFVGNNEYQLSGFELGGRKELAGGRLHVCMAPGMRRIGVARLIVTAIFGNICRLERFEAFTAHRVVVDAGATTQDVSVDGELITARNPLTFRSRPGALRVVVP